MPNEKEINVKSTIMKVRLSLAVIGGLLSAGLANAQSCSTWASNIVAQYQSYPQPSLGARLATNRSDGKYVSYAVTEVYPLAYVPGQWYGGNYVPPSLQSTGALTQFFSDRTYDLNGNFYPFSPTQTDYLGLTIWLGSGSGHSPGTSTFTLYSWGNATVTFAPARCDGMIYGLNGNTGMLLSLFPLQPPPK